jgi:hypothetical protein
MSSTLASFAHEGLMLSLLVPDGWEAEEVAPNQVRFFGPEQSDLDDYRPTMSFTVGEPEGTGAEWFDGFCAAARERLEAYEGFRLLRHERFPLSSLVPVDATWYEWSPEPELTFAQVQALIAVDASRMYLVNAATRAPASDRFLPVFDQVLHSLRVLPPR